MCVFVFEWFVPNDEKTLLLSILPTKKKARGIQSIKRTRAKTTVVMREEDQDQGLRIPIILKEWRHWTTTTNHARGEHRRRRRRTKHHQFKGHLCHPYLDNGREEKRLTCRHEIPGRPRVGTAEQLFSARESRRPRGHRTTGKLFVWVRRARETIFSNSGQEAKRQATSFFYYSLCHFCICRAQTTIFEKTLFLVFFHP